jgi:hypothetical protein
MPSGQALCARLTRTHAIERFTGVQSPRGPGERAVHSSKRPERQPRIRVQRQLRPLRSHKKRRVASCKKLPIVTGFLKIGKPWRSAFSKGPKTARKPAHNEQNTTRNAGISGGLACGAVGPACGASNSHPEWPWRGERARARTPWVGNGWACGLSGLSDVEPPTGKPTGANLGTSPTFQFDLPGVFLGRASSLVNCGN